MSRTAGTQGSLPLELTSFVGRRQELTDVRRMLGASRLVTLTGPGGTGKTRLATRVGADVRRSYPDGVWFVDLSALRAPELVTVEIEDPEALAYLVMIALGWPEKAGRMRATDQLVAHLRDKQALLLLDNCEHLLPVCAVLVDFVLRSCPQLHVLATSREPLAVAGETVFRVDPLAAPEPGGPLSQADLRYESVALFVARAQAVVRDFRLTGVNAPAVAEICRQLDGLPLAIELAATWVRVLAPSQIVPRLAERFALLSRERPALPERQQTLRGCVEWSFDMCSKPERLLWARASVFPAGIELDALEHVCTDDRLPVADGREVLTALVDKSIVVSEGRDGVERFRMLHTIRAYGLDQLAGADPSLPIEPDEEIQLRRRHRDWYVELVGRALAEWLGPRQAEWIDRIDREMPNIRAALQFSLDEPEGAAAALVLARGLRLVWTTRGRLFAEARYWLEQILARGGPPPSRLLVEALNDLATVTGITGDVAAATARVDEARQVAADLGDPRAQAIAAIAGATRLVMAGELATAVEAWRRAAELLAADEGREYDLWRFTALSGLGVAMGIAGDAAGAAACHRAILDLSRARGESWYAGFSLWTLGTALWQEGRPHEAAARLKEGVEQLRGLNDVMGTMWCLEALARVYFDLGQPARAVTIMAAAMRILEDRAAGQSMLSAVAAHRDRFTEHARAALGEPAYRAAVERGRNLTLDETVTYALQDGPERSVGPAPARGMAALSKRERDVAELVARGLSNKEIAAELVISVRTAEGHVQRMLVRLGFTSRAQLAAWVVAHDGGAEPDEAGSG